MRRYPIKIEVRKGEPISLINGKVGIPIRHGLASRNVYSHGDIIVKIDFLDIEQLQPIESQCLAEYRYWKYIGKRPEYKEYFAPVLQFGHSAGYRYVIMPLYHFMPQHNKDLQICYSMERIKQELSLTDIYYARDQGDNWGVTGGRKIIIYDYGYCRVPYHEEINGY